MQGRRRTAWAIALALGATLLAPAATAPPAVATPVHPSPSAAQVRAARAAAAAAARALSSASAARADAQARLDALDARLESAVESWDAAKAAADRAAADLARSRARSLAAQQASDAAQTSVDRLAAESYQVGADLSGGLGEWASVIDSLLDADGITSLTDRLASVDQVATQRRNDVVQTAALRVAALSAQAAATRARDALATAQAAAAAAERAVVAQQQAQRAQVAQLTAMRNAAVVALDRAESHAGSLARRREAALVAAARARARAAAAAAAAADEARRAHERAGHVPSGGYASWPEGQSVTTVSQRLAALAWARTQIGKPYVAGMHGPDSYDCSGLTSAAYRKVGHVMIQYSQAQFAAGRKIAVSALQPGDLVFFAFDPTDWSTIHHVAIYAGDGMMVEAPHTGAFVRVSDIWESDLVPFGARP
jgi:peptidoglycan DL-endopeptidase CwlO